MRFTLILAVAVLLTPAALTARPAASGLKPRRPSPISRRRKRRRRRRRKPKEEYLKAAPGTGPSGPKK